MKLFDGKYYADVTLREYIDGSWQDVTEVTIGDEADGKIDWSDVYQCVKDRSLESLLDWVETDWAEYKDDVTLEFLADFGEDAKNDRDCIIGDIVRVPKITLQPSESFWTECNNPFMTEEYEFIGTIRDDVYLGRYNAVTDCLGNCVVFDGNEFIGWFDESMSVYSDEREVQLEAILCGIAAAREE